MVHGVVYVALTGMLLMPLSSVVSWGILQVVSVYLFFIL